MIHKYLLLIFTAVFYCACNDAKHTTRVNISVKGAAGKKMYLIKVPFLDEKEMLIDSAIVVDLNHPVQFTLNESDERLFTVKVENSGKKYQFINDSKEVKLDINHINGKYNVAYSPASMSLKNFTDSQIENAEVLRSISKRLDSLTAQHEALQKEYDDAYGIFIQKYIQYADTVKSPAGFMAVADNADFGNKYDQQKAFYVKAAQRFPNYQPVQLMKLEVLNMVKIYEAEYQVGDQIPPVTLRSADGTDFSTGSLNGQYYLMDIWSTWCPQCAEITYYKKKMYNQFRGKNFSIVSIAFDDEYDTWKRVITNDSLQWIQLIDEKLWRGSAAGTLKFDSIPFNYLVDPQGKIVAKAIRPDSLIRVISAYVK